MLGRETGLITGPLRTFHRKGPRRYLGQVRFALTAEIAGSPRHVRSVPIGAISPIMEGERQQLASLPTDAARAGTAGKSYSFTLIPASLINLAHWRISDLIIAANSDGVLATVSMPRSCRCLRASFRTRTRAVSL